MGDNKKIEEMNFDDLKSRLNDSFDHDQVNVSEELFQKTLLKIEQEKDLPISNQAAEGNKKKKQNRAVYFRRAAGAVAGLLIVVGCISIMRLGTGKKSAQENSTSMDSMESAGANDTTIEEPAEGILDSGDKKIEAQGGNVFSSGTENQGAVVEDESDEVKSKKFASVFAFDKEEVEQLIISEKIDSKEEERANLSEQGDIYSVLDTFLATDYNEVDNESASIDFTILYTYHVTCKLNDSTRVVDIYIQEDYMYVVKQDSSNIVASTYQMKDMQAFNDSFLKIVSN